MVTQGTEPALRIRRGARRVDRYAQAASFSSTGVRNTSHGSVPERPKGADCKSAGIAFEGSNPSRPTNETPVPHRRFRVCSTPCPSRGGQSISCMTATSSQRLNFRPTSRSTPTNSNPHAACMERCRPGRLDARHDRVETGVGGDADHVLHQRAADSHDADAHVTRRPSPPPSCGTQRAPCTATTMRSRRPRRRSTPPRPRRHPNVRRSSVAGRRGCARRGRRCWCASRPRGCRSPGSPPHRRVSPDVRRP
jgi:hypothetical protein